jgi:hypothetical protein
MRNRDGWLRACRKLFDRQAGKVPHRKFTPLQLERLEDRITPTDAVPVFFVLSPSCDMDT